MESPPQPIEHILIIGAGLAGLALAIGLCKSDHQVTVVERDNTLEEIGAGIQLPANSTRILDELGVLDRISEYCVQPLDLIINSFRGPELFTQNLSPATKQDFGYPHLLIHRADLRRALYEAALAAGANIKLGHSVIDINFEAVAVSLQSGERLSADLIVGADGEHSPTRAALLRRPAVPWSSGDVVYRIAIPTAAMEADPSLKSLVDPPRVHAWYGPGSHAVCYRLMKGGIFNVVLTMPVAKGAATIGPQPADLGELRLACRSWDPRIRKLLDIAQGALKWTLLETEALERWHHPDGRFVLLGDSAHATLPYLAQGAAMAFESAYILSQLLAHREPATDLQSLMAAFSAVRLPRAAAVRARSKGMHDMSQLPDGPMQAERDRALREDEPSEGYPNPWADPSWAKFMWGYDASAEVRRIQRHYGRLRLARQMHSDHFRGLHELEHGILE